MNTKFPSLLKNIGTGKLNEKLCNQFTDNKKFHFVFHIVNFVAQQIHVPLRFMQLRIQSLENTVLCLAISYFLYELLTFALHGTL